MPERTPKTNLNQLLPTTSVLLIGLAACSTQPTALVSPTKTGAVDLRVTEEPYQSQDSINQRMAIVIPYLEKATGLRVTYVPAINYQHSHQMLRDGEVDVINVGVLGGYRLLHNNRKMVPLVVQKPSFRSVLIANRNALKRKDQAVNSAKPLTILRNQMVAFGSRSSGSTFMQPLMHMREQQVPITALGTCFHEPNTNHLSTLVANGNVDFAFIPSFSGDPLHAVPKRLHEDIVVIWQSDPSRNDFMAAALQPPTSTKHGHLLRLKAALLSLRTDNPEHKNVLDTWGYLGFEAPTTAFPTAMIRKVAAAHDSAEGVSTCQDL